MVCKFHFFFLCHCIQWQYKQIDSHIFVLAFLSLSFFAFAPLARVIFLIAHIARTEQFRTIIIFLLVFFLVRFDIHAISYFSSFVVWMSQIPFNADSCWKCTTNRFRLTRFCWRIDATEAVSCISNNKSISLSCALTATEMFSQKGLYSIVNVLCDCLILFISVLLTIQMQLFTPIAYFLKYGQIKQISSATIQRQRNVVNHINKTNRIVFWLDIINVSFGVTAINYEWLFAGQKKTNKITKTKKNIWKDKNWMKHQWLYAGNRHKF